MAKTKGSIELSKNEQTVRNFLGLSGVALGLERTGLTQGEIIEHMTEILRDKQCKESDRIAAAKLVLRVTERNAEINGLIGKASQIEYTEQDGQKLVRRVEVSRLAGSEAYQGGRSFLARAAELEPSAGGEIAAKFDELAQESIPRSGGGPSFGDSELPVAGLEFEADEAG